MNSSSEVTLEHSARDKRARIKVMFARVTAFGVAIGLAGAFTITASRAAFTATTSNAGDSWSAGTVTLTDDDLGAVMFNVTNMKPGDTSTQCIKVDYDGSLTADVKAYAAIAGTGLATYLTTTVEVGSGGSFASCVGWVANTTPVSFTGTLSAFGTTHSNFTNGLAGFAGAVSGSDRTYKITVTLPSGTVNAAQGLTATATFTWEAQNT